MSSPPWINVVKYSASRFWAVRRCVAFRLSAKISSISLNGMNVSIFSSRSTSSSSTLRKNWYNENSVVFVGSNQMALPADFPNFSPPLVVSIGRVIPYTSLSVTRLIRWYPAHRFPIWSLPPNWNLQLYRRNSCSQSYDWNIWYENSVKLMPFEASSRLLTAVRCSISPMRKNRPILPKKSKRFTCWYHSVLSTILNEIEISVRKSYSRPQMSNGFNLL